MTDAPAQTVEQLAAAVRTSEYVRNVLTDKGFKLGAQDGTGVEKLAFKGSTFEISVAIFCGENYITVHAFLPVLVPDSAVDTVLRYLNELNLKQPVGSYELNLVTSKMSFKMGINIPPLPDAETLEKVLIWTVSSADAISARGAEIVSSSRNVAPTVNAGA